MDSLWLLNQLIHPSPWCRFLVHYVTDCDYNIWIMIFAFALNLYVRCRLPDCASKAALVHISFFSVASVCGLGVQSVASEVGPYKQDRAF